MAEQFAELMSRTYQHVVGWGTGSYFDQMVEATEKQMLTLLVDNDKSKWGGCIAGIPVCSPSKLLELDPQETLIIVFSSFFDEIVPTIQACGHIHYLPGRAWVQMQLLRVEEELKRAPDVSGSPECAAMLQYKRAGLLRRAGFRWQEIEALEKAIEILPCRAEWYWELGEACEVMNRFDQAASAFSGAIQHELPVPPVHYYRLGFALESAGRMSEAQTAYLKAVDHHSSATARLLGVAFFHHRFSRPSQAIRALENEMVKPGADACLDYRLGLAHERCFQWSAAVAAYRRATKMEPERFYWHYRLGFACERSEAWDEAAKAYAQALSGGCRNRPSWQYRLGTVLAKAGRFEEACRAFAQALPPSKRVIPLPAKALPLSVARIQKVLDHDSTSALDWYGLGVAYAAEQSWAPAVHAFEEALARDDRQSSGGFYGWGQALAAAGDFEAACRAFAGMFPLGRPSLVPCRRVIDSVALYNECRETMLIENHTILYECFFDRAMSCNPFALFRQIVDRVEFDGWRHVWVLGDKTRIPAEYRARPNIVFISRGQPLYQRYLATAKYLVNNVTFPYQFSRRPEQRFLSLWHGTPLKTLGKDNLGQFFEHKNSARNFLQATHICSPNAHTSRVLIDRYDLAGLLPGRIAETGYPRIDATVHSTDEQRQNLRKRLGVGPDEPVVLYAPTWRGVMGKEAFDLERLKTDVVRLAALPARFLFRGHHLTEKLLASLDLGVQVVSSEIDTNELLSIVDVLVTDYSSIFFDFLPRRKPIVYYVYDCEEYSRTRGLYFDMDEMPGPKCHTVDELMATISNLLKDEKFCVEDPAHESAIQRFCPYEDGHAAERVANWFFFDGPAYELSKPSVKKRNALFYTTAFIPNGITASALNLFASLSTLDPESRICVAVNPNAVSSDPRRLEKFAELPTDVQVLARVGRMNLSPEENWITRRLSDRFSLESEKMWEIYSAAYGREFRRLFGETHFDTIIDFEGYSLYWTSLFANEPTRRSRKAIYLHADMEEECHVRFPYLRYILAQYRGFDALVSVSDSVCQKNSETLGPLFGLPAEKFVHCNNSIHPAKVRELAKESICIPDATRGNPDGARFITVGRLSPEKGHLKLIDAFVRVHNQHTDSSLWIVGDGPLMSSLQEFIAEMQVQDSVHLLGFQSNPYAYLQNADCFVLSSDYEGQGLVLIEAMILNRPVISTDVVGARSVLLEAQYGRLVENSVEGLAQGMLDFVKKGMAVPAFDAEQYQRAAVAKFHAVVLGLP